MFKVFSVLEIKHLRTFWRDWDDNDDVTIKTNEDQYVEVLNKIQNITKRLFQLQVLSLSKEIAFCRRRSNY